MSVGEEERFSRTLALATQVAHDLNLDYYTSDPTRLTFKEAMFLVATKNQLPKVGIPQSLQAFPWRVPNKSDVSQHLSQDNIKKINQILEQSMKVQMGVIPGTEFDQYILSNACIAVSGLLHVYLKELDISSNIVVGLLKFGTSANADATPHTWLILEGSELPIDNTFVHLHSQSGNSNTDLFFKTKHIGLYAKEDPTTTQRRLFYESRYESVCQTLAKVFKTFGNSKQIEKLLVSALSMYCLNPSIKMYDILMKEYIKREFKVIVQDLEVKWKERCWNCEKVDTNCLLKCCSVCKLAKYCSTDCQKKEWKVHKVLHMELDNLITAVALN